MPYLTAAVILVGAATAVNLVLTFGIIRRMRLSAQKAEPPRTVAPPPKLPVGTELAPFTATTVDGREVGRESLLGERSLIGFFSTSCGACKEQAPGFVSYAEAEGYDAGRVLAVVQGPAEETDAFVTHLAGETAAPGVIVEPAGGPVSEALGVAAYPLFYRVDAEGRLEQVEFSLRHLNTTVGA